jgi:cell fate (sporulation/competence/biofilm development) regulator YlbF (YheA/YmcA/DUF963 family)
MNVYDLAHQLAKGLQNCSEYKEYKRLKDKIDQEESTKNMLADFRKRQLMVEGARMMGQEVRQEDQDNLARLFEVVRMNPTIAEFLAAEMRLGTMLADIQKIIGEALDVWTGLETKENSL